MKFIKIVSHSSEEFCGGLFWNILN